jgi:hypothetical protein
MLGTHVAHSSELRPHCLRAIDTIFLAVGNNKRRLHMSIQQRESVHCNVCTSSTFASLCAWHTPTLSFQNRPPALAQPGGGPLQKGSDANTTRRFRPNDPLSLAAARRWCRQLKVKQWNPREGLRPLSRGRRNGPGPRECSRHEPADMEESLMRVRTGASL